MTTEQIQALLDQTDAMRLELEEAVTAGPEGSLRREALAMTAAWLVYARGSLAGALELESEPSRRTE